VASIDEKPEKTERKPKAIGYGLKLGPDGKWVVFEVAGSPKVMSPVRTRTITKASVRIEKRPRGNPERPTPVHVHFREPVDVVEDVGQPIDSAMALLRKLLAEQIRSEKIAARKPAKEAA
jgi:hypothetical protein